MRLKTYVKINNAESFDMSYEDALMGLQFFYFCTAGYKIDMKQKSFLENIFIKMNGPENRVLFCMSDS